jgi:hypothetical protein
LLLSLFLDIINFICGKKRDLLFFQFCFLGIFGTGLISLKSLKAIISSGEMSEGSIVHVLRVVKEGSAEIGNILRVGY